MDDFVKFLIARINDDSHLPMLDLIEQLANDYEAMALSDFRPAGLAYALRVLGQSYTERPIYQQEWRPQPFKESGPSPVEFEPS
ncbi:hypothetical protein [Streptomyces parvulus]|uniref:hypothetical protein n=1 Tax=Streptomyces parvulus TaxID=146923 RepID=UPI0036C7A307